MPASMFVHAKVSPDEHAQLVKRYGEGKIGAAIRKLLGLPERKRGRPPKAK